METEVTRQNRKNAYQVLKERGFITQVTDENAVRTLFDSERVLCYIGFDPTASSFHAGSLVPIMALVHVQRCGHTPIAVIGNGTAMVGDPSGKTEMRKMLSFEHIQRNGEELKRQLAKYLDFPSGASLAVENGDWLLKLNYVEFLRDIGRHFSVNRMLSTEAYKIRLETGLSFIEFNYQLLQAYDFLTLYKNYGCKLQMGGDDQWGNILAGVDLTRRIEAAQVEGITFPLLTTAAGEKMGKTAKGSVWLDATRTAPYDYYQYWINCDDRDVTKFLAFFTLLPMEEINAVAALEGAELNLTKAVLAYEATKITHGENEAKKAFAASASAFGKRVMPGEMLPSSTIPRGDAIQQSEGIPSTAIPGKRLEEGIWVVALFVETGLVNTNGEARRLIQQGGGYINENRVINVDETVSLDHVKDGELLLRAGKKRFHRVMVT